jgi:DNA helicase-2/ATP-dependent DNA helicase PcrA
VLTLEQNYRSTAPLLAASNAVIALAAERHAKQLWSDRASGERPALVWVDDEAAEASWVAERVLALRESGLALRRQAVLFRSAQHSNALELELARRDIPFVKYGGLKFLDAAHVKDVLAVLRFAANPHGQRAGLRALQLVPGIGAASAARLLAALAGGGDPAAQLLAFVSGLGRGAGVGGVRRALRRACARRARRGRRSSPPSSAGTCRCSSAATTTPGRAPPTSRIWFASPAAIRRASASSPSSRSTRRRRRATSPGPGGDDEDYLILSTIHSAKGQEWSAVSVLRVVDGCLPSDMATGNAAEIEEERRLLYVAMTRARHHLHLLVPQRFYVTQQSAQGDRHVYGSISRFLPPALHSLFEHVEPGGAGARRAGAGAAGERRRSARGCARSGPERDSGSAGRTEAAAGRAPSFGCRCRRAARRSASARPRRRQALSTALLDLFLGVAVGRLHLAGGLVGVPSSRRLGLPTALPTFSLTFPWPARRGP